MAIERFETEFGWWLGHPSRKPRVTWKEGVAMVNVRFGEGRGDGREEKRVKSGAGAGEEGKLDGVLPMIA